MALTICAVCDKSYLEQEPACPRCGKTSAEEIIYLQGYSKGSKEVVERLSTVVPCDSLPTRISRAARWLFKGY